MQNKEVANLIRTGLEIDVEESHTYWLGRDEDGQCFACALGLAMIGRMGVFRANVAFSENLIKNKGDEIQTISELLQIKPLLTSWINQLHMQGGTATEIADILDPPA